MSLYRFKTSDPSGHVGELLIEGDTQADATRRLQQRGVVPLEFLGEGSLSASGSGLAGLAQRFDIIDFTDRLVPLIEANIPLERALGILGDGTDSTLMSRVVADLRRGLHEGKKFSELIRDRGRLFPRLFASVVEAGEEAGALPAVMGELRRFLNDSREFQGYLVSALIYPLFVLSASLVVLTILMWVIVPRFAAVLASTGRPLPTSTRLLLDVSDLCRNFWWCVPAGLVVLVVLAVQLRKDGRVKGAYDDAILSVPLLGKMVLLTNLARMARTMAILMRSGVHLLDTVAIAGRVIQNTTLRQSIGGLAGELRQGQRLSHALSHSRFIPPFMLRMLAVGEETGAVETMLDRVADRYESDLKRLVRRTLSLFEPCVIIALGIMVGGVVLAMFFAIMDMEGGL
jgi:general secretion pathway protein F